MSLEQTTLLFQVATPGVSRRGLRAFAKRLEMEVAGGRRFACLIAGDQELRELNRKFLRKDYATDVLSFPALEPDGFLGEIAISFQKAQAQAAERGHPVAQEIGILMLHGVLHLLGMDHQTDYGRMARTEKKWRAGLGLPAGLIERGRS